MIWSVQSAFTFSQHSLSDFQECPRRFYLRYVAQQPWPDADLPPSGLDHDAYLEYLRQGRVLHRWIERHWLGIPTAEEHVKGESSQVRAWWEHFRQTRFDDLPATRQPEVELAAGLGAHRIYARFDLLAHDDDLDTVVVVDWKTLRQPASSLPLQFWQNRTQTRVYLFVLVTAGEALLGRAPDPDHCAMWYWLANQPDDPWVRVPYSQRDYDRDYRWLENLLADVADRKDESQFPQTDDLQQCARCAYRLLCQRGSSAPATDWMPDDDIPLVDIASAPELEY